MLPVTIMKARCSIRRLTPCANANTMKWNAEQQRSVFNEDERKWPKLHIDWPSRGPIDLCEHVVHLV